MLELAQNSRIRIDRGKFLCNSGIVRFCMELFVSHFDCVRVWTLMDEFVGLLRWWSFFLLSAVRRKVRKKDIGKVFAV